MGLNWSSLVMPLMASYNCYNVSKTQMCCYDHFINFSMIRGVPKWLDVHLNFLKEVYLYT